MHCKVKHRLGHHDQGGESGKAHQYHGQKYVQARKGDASSSLNTSTTRLLLLRTPHSFCSRAVAYVMERSTLEDEHLYSPLKDFRLKLGPTGKREGGKDFICFSVWLFPLKGAKAGPLILLDADGDPEPWPFLSFNSSNQLLVHTSPIGDLVQYSKSSLPCQKWSHVALQVLGSSLRMLLDGRVELETNVPAAFFCRRSLSVSGTTKRNAALVWTYNPRAGCGDVGRIDEDLLAFPIQLVLSPGSQNPKTASGTEIFEFRPTSIDGEQVFAMVGGKPSCRRKFVIHVELVDAYGRCSPRELDVSASLVFADSELPVPNGGNGAEAPLLTTFDGVEFPSDEKPTRLVNGKASFKFTISQLASKCENRLFSICFQAHPPNSNQPFLRLLSKPIHSISRKRPHKGLKEEDGKAGEPAQKKARKEGLSLGTGTDSGDSNSSETTTRAASDPAMPRGGQEKQEVTALGLSAFDQHEGSRSGGVNLKSRYRGSDVKKERGAQKAEERPPRKEQSAPPEDLLNPFLSAVASHALLIRRCGLMMEEAGAAAQPDILQKLAELQRWQSEEYLKLQTLLAERRVEKAVEQVAVERHIKSLEDKIEGLQDDLRTSREKLQKKKQTVMDEDAKVQEVLLGELVSSAIVHSLAGGQTQLATSAERPRGGLPCNLRFVSIRGAGIPRAPSFKALAHVPSPAAVRRQHDACKYTDQENLPRIVPAAKDFLRTQPFLAQLAGQPVSETSILSGRVDGASFGVTSAKLPVLDLMPQTQAGDVSVVPPREKDQ